MPRSQTVRRIAELVVKVLSKSMKCSHKTGKTYHPSLNQVCKIRALEYTMKLIQVLAAALTPTIFLAAFVPFNSMQFAVADESARVDTYGDPLPTGAAVRCGTVRYRHPGWFKFVEFIPGTHSFVVSTRDNSPNVWDAETGKQLRDFTHSGQVACLKVVPNSDDAIAMLTTKE